MAAVTSERPAPSLESPPTGEGLTFEKVWAMFQENREQQKETDRLIKETGRLMKENAERQAERQKEAAERQAEWQKEYEREAAERKKEYEREAAEWKKEYAEQQKEYAREAAEWKKEAAERQKELDRRMGDLSNRFGELAEHLVAPCIHERFNELGYHFDAVAPGGYVIRDERGKITAEVDMLLENSDCIMAVEVKTKLRVKDIEHHVKRLEILREYRNKHNDTRKILGAAASPILGTEERKATLDAGFYVIEQSGDTMKIDVPDGFVPQEW